MITVPGFSASSKLPGIFLAVILGGPGTSAGLAPMKALILGNKIAANITGSSPTLAVSAGTQADATPVLLTSADDAATKYGRGSEMHRMARAFFAQYPDGTLYGASVAESGGSAATGVLTFATTASAAFTVRLYACDEVIDVAIASGSTATQTAAAVAAALCAKSDLPYTAQNSSGAVTYTAKHPGPRGNTLVIAASFISATGAETVITASSTSSGAGTTGVFSGNGTLGSELTLSGGTTQDSFANVITAIAPVRYDRVIGACIDATNVGRLATAMASQAAVSVQKRQQTIVPSVDTLANCTTLATGVNSDRVQVAWHYASRLPAWDVAATVAAARMNGDSAAGGRLAGEASDPAANLDGLELMTLAAQNAVADQPTTTDLNSALANGITPLAPSANRPGRVVLVRSITSHSLTGGVPNYSVLDTTNVTATDYGADDMQAQLAVTYAGAKLTTDTADGLPPLAPNLVTPKIVRMFIAGLLKGYEARAICRDVDATMSLLTVVADGTTPGRLLAEIPFVPVPGLHQIAGNVRQLAPAA